MAWADSMRWTLFSSRASVHVAWQHAWATDRDAMLAYVLRTAVTAGLLAFALFWACRYPAHLNDAGWDYTIPMGLVLLAMVWCSGKQFDEVHQKVAFVELDRRLVDGDIDGALRWARWMGLTAHACLGRVGHLFKALDGVTQVHRAQALMARGACPFTERPAKRTWLGFAQAPLPAAIYSQALLNPALVQVFLATERGQTYDVPTHSATFNQGWFDAWFHYGYFEPEDVPQALAVMEVLVARGLDWYLPIRYPTAVPATGSLGHGVLEYLEGLGQPALMVGLLAMGLDPQRCVSPSPYKTLVDAMAFSTSASHRHTSLAALTFLRTRTAQRVVEVALNEALGDAPVAPAGARRRL